MNKQLVFTTDRQTGYPVVLVPFQNRDGGIWIPLGQPRDLQRSQVFSHRDTAGVWRHYHILTLTDMVRSNDPPLKIDVEITSEMIDQFIKHGGVERQHLDRMTFYHVRRPGYTVAFEDGTHLLVDGNHRAVRRWELGLKFMEMYIFPERRAAQALLAIPDDIAEVFPIA